MMDGSPWSDLEPSHLAAPAAPQQGGYPMVGKSQIQAQPAQAAPQPMPNFWSNMPKNPRQAEPSFQPIENTGGK